MRGMLVNFLHDYPGLTNTTNQMGTNAFQGCVKCDIQGKAVGSKKMVYAHSLQEIDEDTGILRVPETRDHESIMEHVADLDVSILNYVSHSSHLVSPGLPQFPPCYARFALVSTSL